MNIFKKIEQALCDHLPIETHVFTRTNGAHVQRKARYSCFKCGKRMKQFNHKGNTAWHP